jgi:NADPH-dependent curcumin reductase CurA
MSSSQPPRKTRQWILKNHPTGEVNLERTFKLVEKHLRELVDDEVLVKTLYISNDPAQRVWIAGDESPRLYVPPVRVGDVMRASLIGEVIDSKSAMIPSGSLIKAIASWTELSIQPASKCTLIPHNPKLSPTHYLGALGTTGVTAYYGLVEVAHATPDDIVLVSGAAGATGSMAIQVAKNVIGCKKVSFPPVL